MRAPPDSAKRYSIKKKVIIGFMEDREQYDTWILPEDEAMLLATPTTIWVQLKDLKVHESITTGNAIDFWLRDGKIELVIP